MTVGEKIYAIRTQAGFSQEEFAEKIGVSRQSVSKWETMAVMPDTEYIIRICSLLNISADDLLLGETIPHDAPKESISQEKKTTTLTAEELAEDAYRIRQENKLNALSLAGFIISFFFAILGTIFSAVSLRGQRELHFEYSHFAVSGIAIGVSKIFFAGITILFVIISYIVSGGLGI